jgi:catechol 2,3-dioxygenase-like lactoylglutathione lyase family enzyme
MAKLDLVEKSRSERIVATAGLIFSVGVSDLACAMQLFAGAMQLRVEAEGAISSELAAAWNLQTDAPPRFVELSGAGYKYGRLRLIERPADAVCVRRDYGPNATDGPLDIGPKAIDFYVADPIGPKIEAVEALGYPARSAPKKHQIGYAISEEVCVTGPDQTPILIMVGHRHRPTSLRPGSPEGPFSEIATVSIISDTLDVSRRFYIEGLGLVAVNDAESDDDNRDLINELVDAPRGTRTHLLLFAEPGEPSGKILLIQFLDVSRKRLQGRMLPANRGFSMITLAAADLDSLAPKLESLGGRVLTTPVEVDAAGGRQRLMLVIGPNEELFEIIEQSA